MPNIEIGQQWRSLRTKEVAVVEKIEEDKVKVRSITTNKSRRLSITAANRLSGHELVAEADPRLVADKSTPQADQTQPAVDVSSGDIVGLYDKMAMLLHQTRHNMRLNDGKTVWVMFDVTDPSFNRAAGMLDTLAELGILRHGKVDELGTCEFIFADIQKTVLRQEGFHSTWHCEYCTETFELDDMSASQQGKVQLPTVNEMTMSGNWKAWVDA